MAGSRGRGGAVHRGERAKEGDIEIAEEWKKMRIDRRFEGAGRRQGARKTGRQGSDADLG